MKLSDSCVRGGKFDVWKTGRNGRKESMSHDAEVMLRDAKRMSFEECLKSIIGIEMSTQSHLEVLLDLAKRYA